MNKKETYAIRYNGKDLVSVNTVIELFGINREDLNHYWETTTYNRYDFTSLFSKEEIKTLRSQNPTWHDTNEDECTEMFQGYVVWRIARSFNKKKLFDKYFGKYFSKDEKTFVSLFLKHTEEVEKNSRERIASKEAYKKENQPEWIEEGQSVKYKREDAGITLTDMAKRIGCSRSKLSNYEKGEPIRNRNMIAKAYTHVLELHNLKQQTNEDAQMSLVESIGGKTAFEMISLVATAYSHIEKRLEEQEIRLSHITQKAEEIA